MWVAVLAALAVHGVVLGTVSAFGITTIGEGMRGRVRARAAVEEAELKESCFNNAVFATSGRTALCFAPWIGDVDQCLADAQMALWMDLSGCQVIKDPTTAITMIEPKAIEKLKPIDAERLLEDARREAEKPKPPPPPQVAQAQPPPPPPPPPMQQQQQVIETVKPNQEQEPENARFLAEFNTRVEKEKVARGARAEPMVAKSKPEDLVAKAKPKDEPSVKKNVDRPPGQNVLAPDAPGKLSMRNPGALTPALSEQEQRVRGTTAGASGTQVADGYMAKRGDGAIEQQRQQRDETARGESGAGGGAPHVPNLKPTDEVLERAIGGGSVDHLENVENSDETALSAKRWVYASFFNRLKRQVAMNWDPGTVWKHSDPTGSVYGFKTRITEVRVSLSKSGDLSKILVTTPSGVNELDDEAVRAFRAAGPFPNPPEGLLAKDNLITFAFSFYFEIGAPHISWRMPQAM